MTPEMLGMASLLMATIAALFAFLAFLRSRRKDEPPPLSKFDAMQLLRTEMDSLKAAGDERERRLQQSIVENLNNFQTSNVNVVTSLSNNITEKTREFNERLDRGIEQSSQQQKERLDEVKKALEGNADQHGKAQEALRLAVESRLDAIRMESASKLDEMRLTVDQKLQATLETRLDQSFSRIAEQLSKVYEQIGEMRTLASNVGSLNNALSNVKIRGTFGEVHLALLIEEFLTPDQYVKNAQVKEHSAERVEYAIKFKVGPEGEELLLPVDAKFPREDYEHLIEASEAGNAQLALRYRKQLEYRIKLCAKDIKEKYICPPRTTDFAILFLPTESLYAEALRQPGLFEYLQRECHVTLAGPTTFAAIINAFRMNFHSLALANKTSEIWRVLSAVRTEFGRYNKVVGSLDRQLRAASSSVEHLGRRTRAMDRKLRTVEALPDDGSAQQLLGLEDGEIEIDDEEDFTNGHSPVPSDTNGSEDTLSPQAAGWAERSEVAS